MADIGKHVLGAGSNESNAEHYRREAVAAALEAIAVFISSGNPAATLNREMDSLGKYADQIQAALKVKAE